MPTTQFDDSGEARDEALELYDSARTHMEAGEFAAALARLQGSAVIHPHAKTLELIGDCLMKLGRPAEAIIPLAASKGLSRHTPATMRLAEAFLAIGDVVSAKSHAEEAVAIMPHHGPARAILARVVEQHRAEFPEMYVSGYQWEA